MIPKSSSQWLDSTVERGIFKLIFSYGLTKKWLLPEFATSTLCLNQPNILLMAGSKNSIALSKFCMQRKKYHYLAQVVQIVINTKKNQTRKR